jgi:hypothetical protein
VIWWLRTRFLLGTAAVTVVTCLVSALASGWPAIPVPNLLGSLMVPLPLVFVLPLVPTWTALFGLGRTDRFQERAAVRGLFLYDQAAWTILILLVASLAAVFQALHQWPLAWAFSRDFLAYLGMGGIAARYLPQHAAALAPTAIVLVCAMFSGQPGPGVRPLAWPMADASNPYAATAAVLIYLAGLWCLRPPARPGRWL